MSGVVEGIILGVLGNAATSVSSRTASKFGRMLVGEELLEKWKIEETALQPMLRKAADALSEVVDLGGPARMEMVCLFLATPEVEAILRQIYATRLIEDDASIDIIRTKFLRSFSSYVELSEESLKDSSNELFDALLEACEYTLIHAIDRGVLSAHDARSEFRYRLLRDELDLIRKNTEYLITQSKPDVDAILRFEEEYRAQLAVRHGYIIPPSFDAQQKLPIDDIYVTPNFLPVTRREDEVVVPCNYTEFLSEINRAVLLGDPGGGKSTFTEKLCYDLATRRQERLVAGRALMPIIVVLREYGAEKAAHGYSILDFIKRKAESFYQLPAPPPHGAFEYLLLNGQAMVIFDGLDELLDTSRRREISGDIEAFCNYYSSVPILVTSRKVGYGQAPLDQEKFEVFYLDAFDDDQVEEYATNWFDADADLTKEERERKTLGFIVESRVAPDLRSNPLMLALMCNIYRRENHIPKNRPEVYRKCAEMLFERWDKDRGIIVLLRAEVHIKPAVMYLAHWIYTDQSLQEGVTERKLIMKMMEYLWPKFYEHQEEGESVAREFVDFCKGRAWVFSGAGRTAEDEELYKFTHRTFLEYFTAFRLVRLHRTPVDLAEALLPRIEKKEWDNVAEMAFHLQEETVEGAWDELLEALVERSGNVEVEERENLLTFAARCLQFMVPSTVIQRKVTSLCLEICIAWALGVLELFENADYYPLYKHDMAEKMIGNLLRARDENLQTVISSFEQIVVERANNDSDDVVASLALEIGLNPMLGEGSSELQDTAMKVWDDASEHIFDACLSRILALSPKELWISVEAFWEGKVSIDDFARWHGVSGIFRYIEMEMFPNRSLLPMAEVLTQDVLVGPYFEKNKYREQRWGCLSEVGRFLLTCPPPWINRPYSEIPVLSADTKFPRIVPAFANWRFDENRYCGRALVSPLNLNADALFGFFAVFATAVQTSGPVAEIVRWVKKSRFAIFNLLRWSLIAPYTDQHFDRVQSEVERCGFTQEQQEFVMRWSRGEIKLAETQMPLRQPFSD